MEVLTPERIMQPKSFSLPELWLELKSHCPVAPSRSQFYEWLRHTWCNSPQPRGGIKNERKYERQHLNRLIRFAELKREYGTLKAAQEALLAEMEQKPEHYLIEA